VAFRKDGKIPKEAQKRVSKGAASSGIPCEKTKAGNRFVTTIV
jgi:hypothetical protein